MRTRPEYGSSNRYFMVRAKSVAIARRGRGEDEEDGGEEGEEIGVKVRWGRCVVWRRVEDDGEGVVVDSGGVSAGRLLGLGGR